MRSVNFLSPIRRQARLNNGLLRWWRAEPFRNASPVLQDLTRKSPSTLVGALRLGQRGLMGSAGVSVFDGTDDGGLTPSIDLSGISTMTLSFLMYWNTFANNNKVAIESSVDSSAASRQGAIAILPNNTAASAFVVRVTTTNAAAQSNVSFTRPSGAAWHHYVCCFDRNAGAQQVTAVYLNGVAQSLTQTATDTTATGGFGNWVWSFGARNGGALLPGGCRLDDIRIYDRVLPAWEARALLHASRRGYQQELRWSRGGEFGGYVEAVEEETEVEAFSVGGAGPLGAEEIPNTVLASATGLTVPAGTKYATVQAVGANFNYFISGDTPTTGATGDGRKLYNYGMIELDCGFTSAKFIREGNTANSKLVVEYFSRKTAE